MRIPQPGPAAQAGGGAPPREIRHAKRAKHAAARARAQSSVRVRCRPPTREAVML